MVPLKLQIDSSFFLQEERDNYVVSPKMKKIWAVELDLLNEFARVCEENGLKWFAHAGTMLGAVRHKGFIPWDDDIDLIMPREDYERFCRIAPVAFSNPYFFQNEQTDRYFARAFPGSGIQKRRPSSKTREIITIPTTRGFSSIFSPWTMSRPIPRSGNATMPGWPT